MERSRDCAVVRALASHQCGQSAIPLFHPLLTCYNLPDFVCFFFFILVNVSSCFSIFAPRCVTCYVIIMVNVYSFSKFALRCVICYVITIVHVYSFRNLLHVALHNTSLPWPMSIVVRNFLYVALHVT